MIRVALLSNNLPSAVRCLTSLWALEPDIPRSWVTLRGTWHPEETPEVLRGIVYQEQEKPFSQTREWNRAAGSGADVLQLEDDVTFTTGRPLLALARAARAHGDRAIVQPSIVGEVLMNAWLPPRHQRRFKYAPAMPLICVFHPAAVWAELGGLDERFDTYGCDDNDYCYRARRAGIALVVLDYLSVRHDVGHSGFRKGGRRVSMDVSVARFVKKWGAFPPPRVPYPPGWTGPPVPE